MSTEKNKKNNITRTPLAQRMRDARKHAGLTQIQLADAIGVDRSYYSACENNTPTKKTQKVLSAKALHGFCRETNHRFQWIKHGELPERDPVERRINPQLETDIQALREIYESGDAGVIDAIHSNLMTFVRTVRTDKKLKESDKKATELSVRCANTERKMKELNAKFERFSEETKKSRIGNI